MAIKGKVSIELHNTITGEDRKIEGDNMVTNALAEYFDDLHLVNVYGAGNDFDTNPFLGQLPISEKLLGGLLIFSDALEEDATKYTIPIGKKLLGLASDDSDNETISRGSYNPEESGKTSTGYKHVWDFATSQCNGVISALSLTHRETGKDIVTSKVYTKTSSYSEPNLRYPSNTVNRKGMLILKNGYMYYAYHESQNIYIYKVKCDTTNFKLNDYVIGQTSATNPPELVTTISNISAGTQGAVYSTDGKDYAYALYTNNGASYATNVYVLKINLSDFSYTSKTITFPENVDYRCYVSPDGYVFAHRYNGSGSDTVYIYNLSTDNITTVTLPNTVTMGQFGITEYGVGYAFNSSSKAWLIYPDGTLIHFKSISISTFRPYLPCVAGKLITGSYYQNVISLVFSNHYLGTIFNLSSAITKTAADTMKIIYTLTDA